MAWLGLDEWQEAQFISGDQYHDAERRELIRWLIEDDYESRISSMVGGNPELAKKLLLLRSGCRDPCTAQSCERAHLELSISLLARTLTKNITPYFIVCLSLLALKCRVPDEFWSVLSGLRVLFSKGWTRELALELGTAIEHPTSYPATASLVVGKAVYDNLLLNSAAHMRALLMRFATSCTRRSSGPLFRYLMFTEMSLVSILGIE